MRKPLEQIAARHIDRLIRSGKLQPSDRRAAEAEIWRMVARGEAAVVDNKLMLAEREK